MANDFPLTKGLGLGVHVVNFGATVRLGEKPWRDIWETDCYVRATDLETLLAKGVRVWQRAGDSHTDTWFNWTHAADKYQALLIGIEPVKRETAEDVLREVLSWWDEPYSTIPTTKFGELKERARKVIGPR